MAKPQPVTVDLLHPTAVKAFKNWGYISFFGCIAVLIPLMFFAINQVKNAYAQRQQVGSIPSTQNLAAETSPERELVEPPYVYRNDELGFSIDYSSLAHGARSLHREKSEFDGYEAVTFWEEVNLEKGLVRPILGIKWIRDSRSLDQYEVDERARVAADYAQYPEMVELGRLVINGVDGLRMAFGDGECGGTVYTIIKDGYRMSLDAQCSWDRAAFSQALQTLRFE